MIYKAPFTAMQKALYSVLKTNPAIGLEWFDSSVPIDEIDDRFKMQAEFAYGIFGESSADCKPNKTAIVWEGSLGLEIYSNYKGRKIVAEKLEAVLNYLSSAAGFAALSSVLGAGGYVLVSLTVRELHISMPVYGNNGVWQSGATGISFQLHQLC